MRRELDSLQLAALSDVLSDALTKHMEEHGCSSSCLKAGTLRELTQMVLRAGKVTVE